MVNQKIISIGREYGSAGHEVAEELGKVMGLPVYDHNMLDEIAAQINGDLEELKKYDEKHRVIFSHRHVRGHTNSPEENIAQLQFDYLQKKAASGESFIIVGRCAETILAANPNMVSFFIAGDTDVKAERIMEKFHLTKKDALRKMMRHDKHRKFYHDRHSEKKWGMASTYDMCINSSKIGIDKTVKALLAHITARFGEWA